jgi:glycosyltransferase involved in cell wall biosynthesis
VQHVSVVVPAHNEAAGIGATVQAVLGQTSGDVAVEAIVVDDGSTDATAEIARAAGARVIRLDGPGSGPAAARNRGAAAAHGDPIVFLDADCVPRTGWLAALLAAHAAGAAVVGGALDLPPGLPALARCDYYCGWYLVHSRRDAGWVPHHPPPNLSIRRAAFLATAGFSEQPHLRYTNEERALQAELRRAGHRIYFEPKAVVYHYNRPTFGNLLRRNYRWAYTALESKAGSGSARMAWLYRYPRLLIAAAAPLAVAHTGYILACWARAGIFEPVLMLPAVLLSRFAYAAGMVAGGLDWLRRRGTTEPGRPPRWQ